MSDDKNFIFIRCECLGEGMGIDYYSEDGHYYFSYWNNYISNEKMSWKQRFRYCWQVLRHGKAFADDLILNQAHVDQLVDFVLQCSNNTIGEEENL